MKTMQRVPGLFLAALLSTVLLSACGKDDKSPAPQPVTATGSDDTLTPTDQPPGPMPAGAFDVHIRSINEIQALDHPHLIYVHPGDVLRFTADSYVNGDAQNSPLWSFSWSASTDGGAVCDASNTETCARTSFLIDDAGVSFVVPVNMPSQISISVWLTANPASQDTLVLQRLGPSNPHFDPRFREFPHWNPDWDRTRHGRWDRSWDRHWDRNRPGPQPQPGPQPGPVNPGHNPDRNPGHNGH